MAATISEQLERLNEAILKVSSGLRTYRAPDGSVVEYQSLDDLIRARNELQAQQAAADEGLYVPLEFGRAS